MQKILLYNGGGAGFPVITHEDQEVHNLAFSTIRTNGTKQFIIINGTEEEITAYLVRTPDIVETTVNALETDASGEQATLTCTTCGGTGSVSNSQYHIEDHLPEPM